MPPDDTRIAGSPQSPSTEYEIDPATGGVLIPLGGKKWPGLRALVDPEDAERVMQHRWSPVTPCTRGDRHIFYAKARMVIPGAGVRFEYLHRYILGLTKRADRVDHVNHNGLDCRRQNMRVVTHQQNIYNRRPNLHGSSPFKGVHWHAAMGKWQALIKQDGRVFRLGFFDDQVDAALVYDDKAREVFGEYAYLNFPDSTGKEAS